MDKSDYSIYPDYLNIQIDGCWLDEYIDEHYPNNFYKGLIPTLLPLMDVIEEEEMVWERILPKLNSITICPILMCPDDCDFSCTIIVVEIEHKSDKVIWKRFGLEGTSMASLPAIGSQVEWFENVETLSFPINAYQEMLDEFKQIK